jgi:predicted O-linked N-acetylglucosamine transferase (SPINDLY family)
VSAVTQLTIQQAYALAVRQHQAGRIAEAQALLRQIVAHDPGHADAIQLLGVVSHQLGRSAEGLELIRRAIALNPGAAGYHSTLGGVLIGMGRYDEAIAALRTALALQPNHPEAQSNLGVALKRAGRLDESIAAYRRALEIRADYPEAMSNLAGAVWRSGEIAEAIQWYDQALQLRPNVRVASNRLFVLHFHPDWGPHRLLEEHKKWEQTYAHGLGSSGSAHANDPAPDRRLRIGYVSPHFHEHVVGHWMLPLLANHRHDGFEIFCYADVPRADAMTGRLRGHADVWRETTALSDERLAQQVRQDRIDILVDLTMHMEGSRLLAFARKPAPVQVTYLAYPGTTGLSAIDYRLTDPYLDPPGMDESCYSERLIRLPRTWCCYLPRAQTPEVSPLPVTTLGRITFGCLNNFGKITPDTLRAWGSLLAQVPGSELVIHAPEGQHRQRASGMIAVQGADPARVRFVGQLPLESYFAQYHAIDIGLDPFPYTGGTTTCDALWMGVPVVSLAGSTAVSRGGFTILSNIGLTELVARDIEQYVRIAVDLARDLDRLAEIRSTLRARMSASPLMDARQFALDIETAYRTMWHTWCGLPQRE